MRHPRRFVGDTGAVRVSGIEYDATRRERGILRETEPAKSGLPSGSRGELRSKQTHQHSLVLEKSRCAHSDSFATVVWRVPATLGEGLRSSSKRSDQVLKARGSVRGSIQVDSARTRAVHSRGCTERASLENQIRIVEMSRAESRDRDAGKRFHFGISGKRHLPRFGGERSTCQATPRVSSFGMNAVGLSGSSATRGGFAPRSPVPRENVPMEKRTHDASRDESTSREPGVAR